MADVQVNVGGDAAVQVAVGSPKAIELQGTPPPGEVVVGAPSTLQVAITSPGPVEIVHRPPAATFVVGEGSQPGTGGGAVPEQIVASEALAAGDYVNVWDNAGAFNVRKAAAHFDGMPAHGFVRAAAEAGAEATVYFEGRNDVVSGQAPGQVWLSTVPGKGTATPPAGGGNLVQPIGYAVSPTVVQLQLQRPVVLFYLPDAG